METTNREQPGMAVKTFSAGILISCILCLPFVLDFTLNVRFVSVALTLLLTAFLLRKTVGRESVPLPAIIYTAFILLVLFGCASAVNRHEAIADSVKIILGWAVFIIVYILHKNNNERLCRSLTIVAILLSLLLFGTFLVQLLMAGSLHKQAMYDITGINGHKNLFSSFLFLNLCFLLYVRREVTVQWKVPFLLALASDIIVIIILRTKAVYIGTACAALTFALYYFLRNRRVTLNALIIVACSLLFALNLFFIKVLPRAIERSLQGIENKSNDPTLLALIDEERLRLWEKTYHLIRERPLTGIGAGNWQVHFPDATLSGIWRAEDLNFTFQRPHNDLLWILSEQGYIG
ncbi:MAG TPA: O-antigen ligase family protein, partial [Chitinophagaceae bacterium]|nr:O-antigen ligase family protein [Chitinophagaceae bacterium]